MKNVQKTFTTPPVSGAGEPIQRSVIEAALTRWQEQQHSLELQVVATNTVIAELTALLTPLAPPEEKHPNPPLDTINKTGE